MQCLCAGSCYSGKLYALTTLKFPSLDGRHSARLMRLNSFDFGWSSSHNGSLTLELRCMQRNNQQTESDYNVMLQGKLATLPSTNPTVGGKPSRTLVPPSPRCSLAVQQSSHCNCETASELGSFQQWTATTNTAGSTDHCLFYGLHVYSTVEHEEPHLVRCLALLYFGTHLQYCQWRAVYRFDAAPGSRVQTTFEKTALP